MTHLVFRAAALRDLASIGDHIEGESGSRATADAFTEKLIDLDARSQFARSHSRASFWASAIWRLSISRLSSMR